MSNNLEGLLIEELRELLQASRQTLTALVDSLANQPDMQDAIRRLMRPDDMLETFSELAVKEPDLMRLVLHAGVAALSIVSKSYPISPERQIRSGSLRRFPYGEWWQRSISD